MNKKIIWGIIIVVILILGIVTVQRGYLKHLNRPDLDNKTVTAPVSNWKIYSYPNKYQFSYPANTQIEETKESGISEITVIFTEDWMNSFDVTIPPEVAYCSSNPYKNYITLKGSTVTENKVTINGNEYRHLQHVDTSLKTVTYNEDKYYLVKDNTCYMLTVKTNNKVDPIIKTNIEKILSTFTLVN